MRISNTAFSDNFLYTVNNLQQQENTLQSEASSGQKISRPEDNPSVMAQVLNDQASQASAAHYSSNITQLQSEATTSATAMNSLQTLSSRVNEIATLASNGTNSSAQLSTYANEMTSLIQQAAQIGNTQDGEGNYIFSGTASNKEPFATATDASGAVTSVSYQGNSNTAQSEIASNVKVAALVPGANTSGSGALGLFADSRTGVDLFAHMISLQQDLASGNAAAISTTDAAAVANDADHIVAQISANGVMQSALTTAGNIATSQTANLTTQISGDTNADLAQTLTQLDQTQTAYEAALESGTKIMGLSLLNYIH
ncbi:MAG TPA: flagellar hook-associated protein FlgL [Candidatus Saccharimonadales bacterium]|nr:flagellar hook-associated protein FlgL [Candidatus Saccharimonadales bacterium]